MAAAVAPGVVAIILPALILYSIDHVPFISGMRKLTPEVKLHAPPIACM